MTRRPLTAFFVVVAVAVLFGYGLFEARRILEGPVITIESPLDGSATSSTGVIIAGEAQNISFLSINDKPSFTNESGHFTKLLSLAPGFTVLTVAATDRFGRKTSRSVSINVLNYCPVKNV
jgi:hypothetical protein